MSKASEKILIDPDKGLEFSSEEELFQHFINEINMLEEEFFKLRSKSDLSEEEFGKYEKHLGTLLEDPDEVWEDSETIPGVTLFHYLREFESKSKVESLYHVGVVYLANDIPSFVYLHFPTKDINLVEKYQRGDLIYDRISKDAPPGAIEGDALLEGDELAIGLYESMLKVRSDKDISEEDFRKLAHLREESIEEADEIWRNNDSLGNILVSFIKEFHDEEGYDELFYVVVTVEDEPSGSHALLFSFPTQDTGLIDRYRHGENLQADEVVQEASH